MKVTTKADEDDYGVDVEVDERDTWSLAKVLAEIIAPSLRVFQRQEIGFPADLDTLDQWAAQIDQMAWAFEKIAEDDWLAWSDDDRSRVEAGLSLFAARFLDLWT